MTNRIIVPEGFAAEVSRAYEQLNQFSRDATVTFMQTGMAMRRFTVVAMATLPIVDEPEVIPNRKKKHHLHLIEQHIRSSRKHRQ